MAKNENPNKLTLATPRGTLVWPKLTEPDHGTAKFPCSHEWGDYKTKLRLDRTDPKVAAFLAKLDAHMEIARGLAEEAFAELPVKSRKALEAKQGGVVASEPYSVVYDEETEDETDFVELNFKMRAGGKRKKDGKEWKAKPALFDSRMKPITKKVEIWGGSTAVINADFEPFFVSGTGMYGIQRRLNAVQIIELVASGGQRSASSYGFGSEEDGFSQDDYVADDDADASDDVGDADDSDDDPQF